MNRKVVIYTVLAIFSVALWFVTHSETAKIKRMFSSIEHIVQREPSESVLVVAAKAQALAKFFTDDCDVVLSEGGGSNRLSRDDIAGYALSLRSEAKSVRLKFLELGVTVKDGQAQVNALADMTGTDAEAIHISLHPRKILANLVKDNGEWRIGRLTVDPQKTGVTVP